MAIKKTTKRNKVKREVTPKKVYVAVPTYNLMHAQFAQSLHYALVELEKSPHSYELATKVGESLIPRGRNDLAESFLKTDCTHLLFLDADLEFSPDVILRLLSWDEDIVCGIYPAKQLEVRYILNQKYYTREDGLISVREAGTGAMLVKREVFGTMQAAKDKEGMEGWYQKMGTANNKVAIGYDFFRTGNFNVGKSDQALYFWQRDDLPEGFEFLEGMERRWYLSEDWYFCQRWRELGGSIYVDPTCTFGHIGQMTYPITHKQIKGAMDHLQSMADNAGVDIEEL